MSKKGLGYFPRVFYCRGGKGPDWRGDGAGCVGIVIQGELYRTSAETGKSGREKSGG